MNGNGGFHLSVSVILTRFCLFGIMVLCSIGGFSQKYNLTALNLEDGLPSENVYHVYQDQAGYIWFATLSGLARYDGYEFRVYNDADGLSDSKIRRIVSYNNEMLVLTWDKYLYRYVNDSFEPFLADSLNEVPIVVLRSEGDRLWLGATGVLYVLEGDELTRITREDVKVEDFYPKDIYLHGDTLWILNQWNGCIRYNLKTHEAKSFTVESDGLVNNLNYCIYPGDNGELLIGGYGGVSVIKGDSVTPYLFSGDPNVNRVMSIAKDQNEGYWLGLYGRGVMHWNNGQELFVMEGVANIPDRYTYSVAVDFENNKWVTTEGGGVYMFNNLSMAVYTKEHGLSSDKINMLFYDKDGGLRIANEDGFIDRYSNNRFITNAVRNPDGSSLFAFDMEVVDSTTYLAGSFGVLKITASDTVIYNGTERGFEVLNVCYRRSNGDILFGSMLGVVQVDNDTLKHFIIRDDEGAVTPGDVRTIVEDSSGTVWLGGLSNLMYLDSSSVRVFNTKSFRKRGLLCSAVSPDGTAWLGGENALLEIQYNNGDTIVNEYDIRKLLNAASLSAIIFDGDDTWIAYERGVMRISLKELRKRKISNIKRYAIESGFPASETSLGAMVQDSAGVIWVGTFKGLVRIDPAKHKKNVYLPQLRLDDVELFSKSIFSENKSVFGYDENYITIHYKAFNYSQSGDVLYSYKLEGLNQDWSSPSTQRFATYAYLPTGKYTFLVKAKYEDGSWSKPQKMYVFEIKAPFWKTWWFYLLIGLIILGAMVLVVYFRLRKARLETERSKTFSEGLLKVQEEERVRIARDLHDTVGQNLLYVRNKVKEMPEGGDVSNQIDSTITEIRQIISAIHQYTLRILDCLLR